MRECPDTETIVTIGDLLNWDVTEGLRHLQTCETCRTRMEALQATRSAFAEIGVVDHDVVGRISDRLRAEARSERARAQSAQRWANGIEALLAGITALVVLVSSGIEIRSISAGLLGFALGATFLVFGRMLTRQLMPTSKRVS